MKESNIPHGWTRRPPSERPNCLHIQSCSLLLLLSFPGLSASTIIYVCWLINLQFFKLFRRSKIHGPPIPDDSNGWFINGYVCIILTSCTGFFESFGLMKSVSPIAFPICRQRKIRRIRPNPSNVESPLLHMFDATESTVQWFIFFYKNTRHLW